MRAPSSNYDDFASVYARHWGPRYAAAAWSTLSALLLSHIRAGGKILDLCCGAGQTARVIADHGFEVTGVDASAALMRRDLELLQTWYAPEAVTTALREVGFDNITITDRQGTAVSDWHRDKAYFRGFVAPKHRK